jgi:hypothetical protein
VDPANRPSAGEVMDSHKQWRDDYEGYIRKQNSPVEDIADSPPADGHIPTPPPKRASKIYGLKSLFCCCCSFD